MSDQFWISLFIGVPAIIGAISSFVSVIQNRKMKKDVGEVHRLVNGMTTKRVEEAKELGNLEGKLEQIKEDKK